MLELFQFIISTLQAASPVTSIVADAPDGGSAIYTGPVDQILLTQASLAYPCIIISQVSESQRTVPQGARDTQVQIDLMSRTSQLELEQLYEAVIAALSYQSGNEATAHVWWMRLDGAVDLFESDRRYWRRVLTYKAWSMKP